MTTSLHISFLRSEKRVGNGVALPDNDVKTEAIEPSSFGLRAGVYVDVIVRNLSEACWRLHGSDALCTRLRGAFDDRGEYGKSLACVVWTGLDGDLRLSDSV
jgi:hypothetical protein